MYSQVELNDAVAAGALSEAEANSVRSFVDARRSAPQVDEESFRLVTSFNDLFVSLAAIILLVAITWITSAIAPILSGLALGGASWWLATIFTARRRMALPSIILLFGFISGVTLAAASLGAAGFAGLIAAGAAYGHWRRFKVPITPAAIAWSLISMLIARSLHGASFFGAQGQATLLVILACGLVTFVAAMWWDSADRTRTNGRSDVAFWLHLLASPLIVHSAFWLSGLAQGSTKPEGAVAVMLVYAALGLIAVTIDRRALLVSGLAYVLFALGSLVFKFGTLSIAVPVAALLISSSLLLLSATWTRVRRAFVPRLPKTWQDRLPIIDRAPSRSGAPAA